MAEAARHGAIDVGVILAETYEITRILGRGGMGAVWEARHLRLEGKKVAIKVLHPEVASDTDAVARFRREAQIASRLGHPNIVQVHDFNTLPDGTAYLVLEFLEGESLGERLRRGPLPLEQVAVIARQIGSALQAAHEEDIVHRDLKPHNVFLSPTESGGYVTELVKVLDFGISKIRGSTTVKTQTSAILGTPQYMAPEQAMGDHRAVDGRTDVFALGAMIYEMLTGQAPFGGHTIPEVMFKVVYGEPPALATLVPALPQHIVDAVERALAKKQEDRFADASSFIEALTGNPLATLRGHAVSRGSAGAPGSLAPRAQSEEALAATMASQAGVQATADTMASQAGAAGVQATAGTVAAPGTGDLAATMAPNAPVAPQETKPGFAAAIPQAFPAETARLGGSMTPAPDTPGRPSHGRALLPYIFGLGALLIAAAALVIVLRGRDDSATAARQPASMPVDGEMAGEEVGRGEPAGDDLNGRNPAGDDPVNGDDPAARHAGQPPPHDDPERRPPPPEDHRPPPPEDHRPPPPDDHRPPPADPPPDDRLPAALRKELAQATALLDAGQPDAAIRAARHTLGTMRTPVAYAIITRAFCVKRDLGNARANLHHVRGRMRAKLLSFCSRHDIDLR